MATIKTTGPGEGGGMRVDVDDPPSITPHSKYSHRAVSNILIEQSKHQLAIQQKIVLKYDYYGKRYFSWGGMLSDPTCLASS